RFCCRVRRRRARDRAPARIVQAGRRGDRRARLLPDAAAFAIHQSMSVVDMAYRAAGSTAIFEENPFGRRSATSTPSRSRCRAGNTGIGLALVGNARGYRTVIVMPETQSQEKKDMLLLCGVDLRLVPAVPYANPMNYVRYSGRLAEEIAAQEPNGAIWANQFDNLANRRGHYETTGPEIWEETDGKVDGVTCAVGTGGTLSGVGIALKERNPNVQICLSDCMGSGI